jgi:hypothetical protein
MSSRVETHGVGMPWVSGPNRAFLPVMRPTLPTRPTRPALLSAFAAVALLLPGSSCVEEEVLQPGDVSTCEGPRWKWRRDLGFTRWSDSGAESAESGGVVLVAWGERREESLDDLLLRGVLIDAVTGETRQELDAVEGDVNDLRVRGVDDGFFVFARQGLEVVVFFVAHEEPRWERVANIPIISGAFDAVATDAGVLAFGDDGIHVFDGRGRFVALRNDGLLADVRCRAGTARIAGAADAGSGVNGDSVVGVGEVIASCQRRDGGGDVLLSMTADGRDAVEWRNEARPREWPPVLAAGNDVVFVAEPDDNRLSVVVLDTAGRERVSATPLDLQGLDVDKDVGLVGGGSCTANCSGISLVAQNDVALLEAYTVFPRRVERFLLRVEGDTLRVESHGLRETASRQGLTATRPGALSTWLEFGPHVPVLDLSPPQTVVVERTCLREDRGGDEDAR